MKPCVTGFVTVVTEQRKGYFAAITNPLAITAYGNTKEEATKRAIQAVFLLATRGEPNVKEPVSA